MGFFSWLIPPNRSNRIALALEFDKYVRTEHARIILEIQTNKKYTADVDAAYDMLISNIVAFYDKNPWAIVNMKIVRGCSYPKECEYLGSDYDLMYGDLVWTKDWDRRYQINEIPSWRELMYDAEAAEAIRKLIAEGKVSTSRAKTLG